MSRGPFPTFPQSVSTSSLIFIGVLVAVQNDGEMPNLRGAKQLALRFVVERVLKGEPARELTIRGDTSTSGFGAGVKPGDRLLIFAGGNPPGTGAHSHNRLVRSTAEVEGAVKEVADAMAGTWEPPPPIVPVAPVPPPPAPPEPPPPPPTRA